MKLKNIIVSLAVLLVLPACTDEKMIEEVDETGTFSINLSMGEMEVKSSTEANVPATSNERSIGYCFIAVFSKKNNEDNWSNLVWKKTELANNFDGTYQINGLEFPIKTPLKIVVIANPPAELMEGDSQYQNIDSYSSVQDLTTVYTDELGGSNGSDRYYTFNPKSLIKFGEKDVEFKTKSGEETIELTQLAAKIHLNFTVEEKESKLDPKENEYTFSFGEYSVDEVLSLLNKENNIQSTEKNKPCYITDDNGQLEYVTAYPKNVIASAYVESDKGQKFIRLSGGKISELSYKPSHLFKLKQVKISNIETFSYLYDPKGCTRDLKSTSSSSGLNSTNFSFYSYSKPFYEGDEKNALKVELEGWMADGYEVTKTEYLYTNTKLAWSEDSGFGNGGFVVKPENIEGLGESGTPIIGDPIFVSESKDTNTYTIIINPSKSSAVDNPGIQSGNYYEVTGKLKEGITGLSITVKEWGLKKVEVSYGK